MSNLIDSHLPRPVNGEAFESIVVDYCNLRFNKKSSKYGRSGQIQHGVDIFFDAGDGSHCAIQCKNFIAGISYEKISNEIEKTKNYPHKINQYIITTTAPRDKSLQDEVSNYNSKPDRSFYLEIVYWDEIASKLIESLPTLRKHFPDLFINSTEPSGDEKALHDIDRIRRILSCIELDMFDSYIRNAPDTVSDKFMEAPNAFEDEWRSPLFVLHNDTLQQKIGEFFWYWNHLTLGMNGLNGYNCFLYHEPTKSWRFNYETAREGDYSAFREIFEEIHRRSYEIVGMINKEYPSVNLTQLSEEARAKYPWIYKI